MSLDELRDLLGRHARPDLNTAIDGVRICRAEPGAEPEYAMSGVMLAVIAQGAKRLALGDRVYEYGVGQYLVASADLPVVGRIAQGPELGFGMTLEPAVIAELMLQAGPGDLPPSTRSARPGITVSDAPRGTGTRSATGPCTRRTLTSPERSRTGPRTSPSSARRLCRCPNRWQRSWSRWPGS